MNEIIEKIKQELLETEAKNPKNEYQDGVRDGYISGLHFAIALLNKELARSAMGSENVAQQ